MHGKTGSPLKTKFLLAIEIIFFILMAVLMAWAVMLLPKHGEIVYNCTWVEISPDIPPKVREECRKLNVREIK